jgi:L-alanine-DL-glutamate epimerase-like enolase superfamily enzyme
MHLYATVTNAVRPHEYSREFSGARELVESLFDEPFVVENGEVQIPDRPGLGLTINEAGLKNLSNL